MSVEAALTAEFRLLVNSSQGPQTQNTMYFTFDSAFSVSDMSDVADELITRWNGNVKATMSSLMQLVGVRYRDISTDPYGLFFETVASITGTASSDATPLNACAEVRLIGTSGGQPRESYIRVSGFPDTYTVGNGLTSSGQSDIATAWAAMYDGIATPLGNFSILSRVSGGSPRPSALVNAVESITVPFVLRRASSRAGFGR